MYDNDYSGVNLYDVVNLILRIILKELMGLDSYCMGKPPQEVLLKQKKKVRFSLK